MIGHTYAAEPHGTIITLWVWVEQPFDSNAKDHGVPVHFDHRVFRGLWEARPGRVLDQDVEVTWNGPEGPTVRFLDEDEDELTHDYKPGSRDGLAF